ncbi:MAG: Asp-tRNA(Asn)/Glu-tRNA(Gln) amidotransferase GatCAB subunit B, partial [Acidimicrobiia bacterium]|nr:Asp-tRNA(Asn)/Glu-tRNA(Gln) amidotransferase GatCAB subunit B [Acidimicrobiia bacterium]
PAGADALGTKVEIKNMNSFRSLERAVAHEIERQTAVVESGGEVVQETRHWDEDAGVTHAMRTKEGSSDYRYFAEPDLTPMVMDRAWVDEVGANLPELPAERRGRYEEIGLDPPLAEIMSSAPPDLRRIFEDAVDAGGSPRSAANWVTGELTAWVRRNEAGPSLPLTGDQLAELVAMVDDGKVSASAAKEVLEGVLAGEGSPTAVAEARNLTQISDRSQIEDAVDGVIAGNPDAVESFRSGEEKVLGFLVGQVMRATGGKADPKIVNQVLRDRFG